MWNAFRIILVLFVCVGATRTGLAEDQSSRDRASIEEARRAIETMRGSYAYVVQKLEVAKAARDPVRLNRLHDIANRIADLIGVATHALDDMRVAIASQEAPEAVEAELEKILLVLEKVEQARREADAMRTVDGDNPGVTIDYDQTFGTEEWNLTSSVSPSVPDPPLPNPMPNPNCPSSLPPPSSQSLPGGLPPPGSTVCF